MEGYRYTKELVNYYISRGWWTPETWADTYDLNARGYPDKVAFVDSKRRVTWKQFKQMTDRIAIKLLELGFNKDDVVICQLHNCVENVAIRIALEKAGLIHCFAAMNLREGELNHFLKTTEAVAVVTTPSYHGFDHFEQFKNLHSSGKDLEKGGVKANVETVQEGKVILNDGFCIRLSPERKDYVLRYDMIFMYHIFLPLAGAPFVLFSYYGVLGRF